MKLWKKYKGCFLAFILMISMIGSVSFVSGAFAQETDEKEATTEFTEVTQETSTTEITTTQKKQAKIQTQSENQPFDMECTFDGKILDNTKGNVADNWNVADSKTLKVTLTKNREVNVDSAKKYYVCLKVPDMFYFNGLPDASKINGVSDVKIIKNTTPKVNNSAGSTIDLEKFSAYSGEIRLEINPTVEVITITDIGISCNEQLIGYVGGSQTINSLIGMSVVKVDKSKDIQSFGENDEEKIADCRITEENVTSGSLSGTGLKNVMSITGFNTEPIDQQDVTLGSAGKIAYAGGTAGANEQVYKEMTVVFHCPYILDNENQAHYLKFDLDDTALSNNKQGSKQGYKLDKKAEYNESNHTITYTFKDIYLGGHTNLFYSPNFSWPEDMDVDQIKSKIEIKGADWEISNQTCYTGAGATLRRSYSPTKHAYYIPEQVDVAMTSSAQASKDQKIAKRYLYQGLTREKGNEGTLGFFDVHNNGSIKSPELNIRFSFNTDPDSKGKYYVTRVNLPVDQNTKGTDVEYILTNDSTEIKGTIHYTNKTSFACNVKDLRTKSGVDGTYYIKDLSYTTQLKEGTMYHAETAHLNRNREKDSGLFFGYIEGELNQTATAKMTIASKDGETKITADNKRQIESTETSWISSDDYIAYGLTKMQVNGDNTQYITAGDSTKLNFGASISTEEYSMNDNGKVNGYHVFRDGIMYICLPKDVSIAGKEQVKVTQESRNISIDHINVRKVDNSECTVNDTEAQWWQIEVEGINALKSTFSVEVQLSTNNQMKGIVWNFRNCVGIRVKDQKVSWAAASNQTQIYQDITKLTKSDNVGIRALGNSLKTNENPDKLGICFYNSSVTVKLNIARAEARLGVETALQADNSSQSQNLKITDKKTKINYDVKISSNDGGYANDFSYYIPIVSSKSAIDVDGLVAKNEFNLQLQSALEIKDVNGKIMSDDESPYEVTYTTKSNLNSTTIREDDVEWKSGTAVTDYSEVTAIRIVTKQNKFINNGETYEFISKLGYDGDDFDQMAGKKVQWRSFGHYTYTRNNAQTTNTYPSQDNMITIGYQKDLSGSEKNIMLDTADTAKDPASEVINIEPTFKKLQELKIKKIEVSGGTQLIGEDPKNLTGTQANNKFKITCKINQGSESVLLPSNMNNTNWTVEANEKIKLTVNVYYSKAMTDAVTPRYVKLTIGNDDIDMIYQINLKRIIQVANATGSGITAGEIYQVPKLDPTKTCSISQNSSFTGLYVVNSFVSGNFKNQMITWKKDNVETNLPNKTTVIMMPISEDNRVEGYWYYKSQGGKSKIDLKEFVKMSGKETYNYDTSTTTGTTLRYLFVVNFGRADASVGNYKLAFGAEGISDDNKFDDVELPVTLEAKTTYSLDVSNVEDSELTKNISYKINKSKGNDSYSQGKTLALVITPEEVDNLPADVYLSDGENKYTRTKDNQFIIPIGTIEDGTKKLTLKSDMFPEKEITYKFKAQLYLVNSNDSKSALSGEKIGEEKKLEFTKKQTVIPSLKVTGTQVATISDWSGGQDIQISMKNITTNEKTLIVTPYIGITGIQKATDLLSSVSGVFQFENGIGTYDSTKTATNKLVLNSSIRSGTYRLIFEVKDKDGETELTVPYYIIVK